ncbi:hypothetical protein SLS61_007285 [Didymella pomorum]
MAPVEFHRYIDGRGDTIIYKFDPVVARSSDPKWPNDTPVTVYQHFVIPKRNGIENHHSDLLPLELAVTRVRADKAVSQPLVGKVMHTEDIITDDGAKAKIQLEEPLPQTMMFVQAADYVQSYDHIGSLFLSETLEAFNVWKMTLAV